tara:strand:- start:36718 stop:37035 length:318 start_codon:yes stop_codon:yes gene_type:complete
VRFPDGMRERIREIAEANGRSMNAEIIERLGSSLKSPEEEARDREHMLLMHNEIQLMQDFMREMFAAANGNPEKLEKSEIFKRAGEVDAKRLESDRARGLPDRKK